MPTAEPRLSLRDRVQIAALPEVLRQHPLPDGGPPDPEYFDRLNRTLRSIGGSYVRLRGEGNRAEKKAAKEKTARARGQR